MAKPRLPKKSTDVNETVIPAAPGPQGRVALTHAPTPGTAEATATETRKTTRKPEIVKSDSRANLVPINIEDEIRRLAYLYSERRGFEPGHETEDWLAAEDEVRQRYRQQSA